MAEIGKEGPHFDYSPNGGGASGPEEEGGPDDLDKARWSSGLLEKVTSKELTRTPQQLRWRTWRLLEGVVDRGDDFTARIMRDRFESRLGELEEVRIPGLRDYLGGSQQESSEADKAFYREFKEAKEEAEAVLTLFIDFGNYYEKVAPRAGDLSKVAFSNDILELHPINVLKKTFELRGFKTSLGEERQEGEKEEEEALLGDQIDTVIRAYAYISANSDKRLRDEREWMENSEGFSRLFKGDTDKEGKELVESRIEEGRDWIREMKLQILPQVEQDFIEYRGRSLEELKDDHEEVVSRREEEKDEKKKEEMKSDLEKLDYADMPNRFAMPLSIPNLNVIEDAIRDLAAGDTEEGSEADKYLLETQARIAEKLGRNVFRYFGLAAYYGGNIEFDEEGEEKGVSAEGHPWSDAFLPVLDVRARIKYDIDKDYWPGPEPFVERCPDKLYTHFFRFAGAKDLEDLDSKRKIKSLWTEMWEDNKRLRELPWDRVGDYPVKSYWIRYVFLFMETTGVMPAFKGETWIDEPKILVTHRFWKDVRKAINIVVREPVITNGEYEKWFDSEEKKKAVEKQMQKLRREQEYDSEEELRKDAENKLLSEAVEVTRKQWKNIIVDSIRYWHETDTFTLGAMEEAIEASDFFKN